MGKNKWSRMCGKSCNLSRVDLEITHESYEKSIKFLYTIKNTGAAPICGSFYIESELMGKLCYDSLVLPVKGDTFTVSKVYESGGDLIVGPDGIEVKEEARAYVKLCDSWIYTNKETETARFKLAKLLSHVYTFSSSVSPRYTTNLLFVTNMSEEVARNVRVEIYDSDNMIDFNTAQVYEMYTDESTRVPYNDFVVKDRSTLVINLHNIDPLTTVSKVYVVSPIGDVLPGFTGINTYSTADNFDQGTTSSFFRAI